MRPIDADELLARMRERCDSCQHKGNREHCLNLCEWREAMDEVDDMPEIEANVTATGSGVAYEKETQQIAELIRENEPGVIKDADVRNDRIQRAGTGD